MVIPEVIPPLLCAVHCNVQSHFWEEIPPNVQPKFLLVELETIFFHPVAGCLEEEADNLATSSCPSSRECWGHAWIFSGPGFQQPGLGEGVPAYGSGVGTRWSLMFPPAKPFYNFVIRCKMQETQPDIKSDAQRWTKYCSAGEGLGGSPQEGSSQLSLSQLIPEVCCSLSCDSLELG